MVIQVDTREHKSEWERIQSQFDNIGVQYFRSKLYCGDYQSLDNAKLCIDRKKDLQELCGNVCQQHERFKAELIRAREAGIQLIILCEHGPDIKSVGDVYFWENPRKHKVIWRTVNGKKVKTVSKNKTIRTSVKKLASRKTYYVRVRTYKTVKINGKSVTFYSAWSKAKSVKVK